MRWILTLYFLIVSVAPSFSIEMGVLNVFTDLPESTIKVDGLVVAKESVVKLPLQVGEHYVQVENDHSLVYAEKVMITENRTTTVVSDHFVDIITKTPSRGAIDREAVRLRESRGNFAFGYHMMSVLRDAISIKWWSDDRMGLQFLAGGNLSDATAHRGILGARLFISPADKIYADDILTGYVFTGIGQKSDVLDETIQNRTYVEFGINIETFVGK